MTSSILHRDLEDFKRRVDFPIAPDPHPDRVLAVDWRALRPAVEAELKDLSLEFEGKPVVLPDALPQLTWVFKGPSGKVVLSVRVAGGPDEARAALLSTAAATMMEEIPYQRGPRELDDFSVMNMAGPSQVMYWAYRNVFISLSNDRSGFPILPLARRVHQLLNEQGFSSAQERLPAIGGLVVSSDKVHVGDTVEVSVTLGRSGTSGAAVTSIGDVSVPRHMRIVSTTGARAELEATAPGRAEIAVRAMDLQTLLSATRRAQVQVSPKSGDR